MVSMYHLANRRRPSPAVRHRVPVAGEAEEGHAEYWVPSPIPAVDRSRRSWCPALVWSRVLTLGVLSTEFRWPPEGAETD